MTRRKGIVNGTTKRFFRDTKKLEYESYVINTLAQAYRYNNRICLVKL